MYNTGCPGWDSYGSSDGFIPCDEDTGCATQYEEKIEEIICNEYPIESKGCYDRFAIGNEESVWVCQECGAIGINPDEDDHDCPYLY
jgi:hypothetical protein